MNEQIKRNIKLEYIFRFLGNFSLTEAIWVLYLAYKGMSLGQIGILEGIFHLTSLVSEVPSGAMADRMGRKNVIILSRISNIISCLIMFGATKFWQFALAFLFTAWAYNLLSGSEEAMLYDSFLYLGDETGYYKVNSRLEVIVEVAQGIGPFVGGVLSEKSFAYCYIGTTIFAVLSLISCFMFKDPELKKEEHSEKVSIKQHFVISYKAIKESPQVTGILFFYALVFTFYTSVYFLCQQYFLDLGLSKVEISMVLLMIGAYSCAGALFSEKLVAILKDKTKYIASLCIVGGMLLMAGGNVLIALISIGIMSFANALLCPLQSASLNKLIPSEQRATIISVSSMIFSIFMIIFFPLMGLLADKFGLEITFFVAGVVAMCSLIVMWKKRNW